MINYRKISCLYVLLRDQQYQINHAYLGHNGFLSALNICVRFNNAKNDLPHKSKYAAAEYFIMPYNY